MKAQISQAKGFIDGMVIWGDVAYTQNIFDSYEQAKQHPIL
jgi:hypothetical protein